MKRLSNILQWFIICAIAGIPLFFLPITQEYYDTNKWYAFMVLTLLTGIVWFVHMIRGTRKVHIAISAMAVGYLAISVASIVSLIGASPNKIEALLTPFGPLTFVALALFTLLAPALLSHVKQEFKLWPMYVTTSLLALISIYQYFGLGKTMMPAIAYLSDPLWTPTGSTAATISLFLLMLPLLFAESVKAMKDKQEVIGSFLIIMTLTVITGTVITLWQFFPKLTTTLLPQSVGWAITLEILKNIKNAVMGVGAENFLAAFSIGRPVSYNISPIWSIRFVTNSNFLFHMTTINGLLGLFGSAYLLKSLISRQYRKAQSISLYIALFLLLFSPPSLPVLIAVTFLYIASDHTDKKEFAMRPIHAAWLKSLSIVLVIALCAGAGYGLYRTYHAEVVFRQSLASAQANNGTLTYNLQVKAIQENPYSSKFHIIYSQTNLALATSLASTLNQTDAKKSPDDINKDRQLIAQLIQQSLREAKLAAKLDTYNVLAWENLARIYGQLVDIAQGADNWADAAYKQAIALDPSNPVLRLELGSVSMKQKKYTDAITTFQKAASLKPNYANAYYNLAYAYKLSGDKELAVRALTQTQQLVDKKSEDYTKVTQELEALKNAPLSQPSGTSDQPASLKPPATPSPKAVISPPIALPSDSGPNVNQ